MKHQLAVIRMYSLFNIGQSQINLEIRSESRLKSVITSMASIYSQVCVVVAWAQLHSITWQLITLTKA